MKRKLLVAVPLLCVVALLAWLFRPKHETLGEGYISESSVTLWSSIAQVREPLDSLHYGDKVEIVARHNDFTKVRSSTGAVGWVDARLVMEPAALATQRQAPRRSPCAPRPGPRPNQGRHQSCAPCPEEPNRASTSLVAVSRWKLSAAPSPIGRKSRTKKKPTNLPSQEKKNGFSFAVVATRPPGENNVRSSETTTTTPTGRSDHSDRWLDCRPLRGAHLARRGS